MDDEIVPANNVRFEEFCNLLETLHKKKKQSSERDRILATFINDLKLTVAQTVGRKNSSIYPILRLLLPNLERERSAYNLKQSKLGELLVKVLSLNRKSRDAQKLLNYRSVNNAQDNDFAGVAYSVLKGRLRPSSDAFSIGEINEILDSIASPIGNKGTILDKEFSHVIKVVNGIQLKWFLRIILKDLKLGMGHKRILDLFHPDASEYQKQWGKLSKVCEELADGDTRPSELGIQLFLAVSPMLLEKFNKEFPTGKLPTGKTYHIEVKFDGERFQMHMENGIYEYFSRNGHPFSSKYGKTYESGLLTPFLKDTFNHNVNSFILDGEMMGWHKERQCFGSKGMAYDIKKITENSQYRPCYCVFDVLYYNGKALVGPPEKGGLPLKERLEYLDSMFIDQPGVIQRSKRQIVKQSSDVLDALKKADENEDEGIVVKDVDSYYIVNRRNAGWYKLKPEYIEGTMSDLDLVIIGADEAEDKKHGRAKSFFVACADDVTPGDMPQRWVSVGRVSTGLSLEKHESLCATLERHWTSIKKGPPPSNLVFNKEKPDFWVLPQNSVTLTVRASELIRSADFGTAYTLRFPRVLRVRDDKPVKDVMTLEEFKRLFANKGPVVKLSTNQITEDQITNSGSEVNVRKKRVAQALQVAEHLRVKPSDDVEVTSRALHGRKLCILSEDEDCKRAELANLIKSHGGEVVADPGHAWCCVAGRVSARIREYIESQVQDVVTTTWLRSLPPSAEPCALHPLDMIAMKTSTRLALSRQYDAYGDGYTELTDEDKLKKCFDKMDNDKAVEVYLTDEEMLDLDRQIFDGNNPHSFLRPCCIFMADQHSITAILAKMYGATLVSTPTDGCTHIVVHKNTDPNKIEDTKRQYKGIVVRDDWLQSCFSRKELVTETPYVL